MRGLEKQAVGQVGWGVSASHGLMTVFVIMAPGGNTAPGHALYSI